MNLNVADERKPGSGSPPRNSLPDLINRTWPDEQSPQRAAALEVKELGNRAIHRFSRFKQALSGADGTVDFLTNMRLLLRDLYVAQAND